MSSSEDDVHQCGRCKQEFHDLDLYLVHKKEKTCQKLKHQAAAGLTEGQNVTQETLPQQRVPVPDKPVKAPAKKRRAARELVKHNDADDIYDWNFDPSTERRGRGSKRRATAKNLKKAWAENYKDSVHQNDATTTSSIDVAVPVKKGIVADIASDTDNTVTRNGAVTRQSYRNSRADHSNQGLRNQGGDGDIIHEDTTDQNTQDADADEYNNISGQQEESFSSDADDEPIRKRKRRKVKPTQTVDGRLDRGSMHDDDPLRKRKRRKVEKVDRRRVRGTIYQCPACPFCTFVRGEYDRHLRKEHPMSEYSCSKCDQQVKHPSRLEAHVVTGPCEGAKINHVPNKYDSMLSSDNPGNTLQEQVAGMPGVCLRVLFPYDEFQVNVDFKEFTCTGQHGVIQLCIKCLECDTMCLSFRDALAHFYDHWQFYPSLCRYCAKIFHTRRGLIRHITSTLHDHLNETQLGEARKEINDIMGLDGSLQSVTGVLSGQADLFDCPKCDLQFDEAQAMASHLVDNHQLFAIEQFFHCGVCGDLHLSKDSLESHLRQSHPGATVTSRYRCPVCDKAFKVKVKVIKHIENLHTSLQQAPYDPVKARNQDNTHQLSTHQTCFICSEIQPSRSEWLRHMYNHRVWVADELAGGPLPSNLFEDIGGETPVLKIHTQMEVAVNVKVETPEDRKHRTKQLSLINQQRRKYTRPDPVSVLQNMAENIPKPGTSGESSHKTVCQSNNESDELSLLLATPEQIATSLMSSSTDADYRHGDKIPMGHVTRAGMNENDIAIPRCDAADEDIQGAAGALLELGESDVGAMGSVQDAQQLIDEATEPEQALEPSAAIELAEHDAGEEEAPSSRFLCPFCLTLTDTLDEMYQHKIEHHRLMLVFRCVKDHCGQTFLSLHDFEAHSSLHSQKAFICNCCNWHVPTLLQLISHKTSSHRTIHSLDTGHCCQICHMTFVSQKALLTHVEQDPHHHQCTKCRKVFKTGYELEDHKMVHTDTKVLLCDKCGATFVNRLCLNRHRQIHANRSHTCQQCNMTFNKGEHLRRHMISIHSDEKPHHCPYPGCDKQFKRKDKMQEHHKRHDDDKPYQCNKCGKRYRYREGLRYHEKKAHPDEGTYKCPECSVTFNRPSMLQQHLHEKHAVKKKFTYQCSMCDSGFFRPERLNRHLEKQHSVPVEWLLKCNICQKGFPGEKSYESHMKSRHKNEKNPPHYVPQHVTDQQDMVQQAMDQTINLDQPSMYEQFKVIPARALYNPDPPDNKVIHAQGLYDPSPEKVYNSTPQVDPEPCLQQDLNTAGDAHVMYQPEPVYNNQIEPVESCAATSYQQNAVNDVDKPSATVEWFTQPMPPLQHINIAFEGKASQSVAAPAQQLNQIPPLQPLNHVTDIAQVHIDNPNLTAVNLGTVNLSSLPGANIALSQANLTINPSNLAINQPSMMINQSVDQMNLSNVHGSSHLTGQLGETGLGTVDLNNTIINIIPSQIPAVKLPSLQQVQFDPSLNQKEQDNTSQNHFVPNQNQNEPDVASPSKLLPDMNRKSKSKRTPRKNVKAAKKSAFPEEMPHAKLLMRLQLLHDQQQKGKNESVKQTSPKSTPSRQLLIGSIAQISPSKLSQASPSINSRQKISKANVSIQPTYTTTPIKATPLNQSFLIGTPEAVQNNVSPPSYNIHEEQHASGRAIMATNNFNIQQPTYSLAVSQPSNLFINQFSSGPSIITASVNSKSNPRPSYSFDVTQPTFTLIGPQHTSNLPASTNRMYDSSSLNSFDNQTIQFNQDLNNSTSTLPSPVQSITNFTPITTYSQQSFTLPSDQKIEHGQKLATLPRELTDQLKQLLTQIPKNTIIKQPIKQLSVHPSSVEHCPEAYVMHSNAIEGHSWQNSASKVPQGPILQAALTGKTDFNNTQLWTSELTKEAGNDGVAPQNKNKIILTGLSNDKESMVVATGVPQEKEGIVYATGPSQGQEGLMLTPGIAQSKEGMVFTGRLPQPGKGGMIFSGGFTQGGKEAGMLLTTGLPELKDGVILTPQNRDNLIVGGLHSEHDSKMMVGGFSNTKGMILTAPGLAVAGPIQTNYSHDTLASLLSSSSGKQPSVQNEPAFIYPQAYLGGSVPQTAYVFTPSSQSSVMPQLDQQLQQSSLTEITNQASAFHQVTSQPAAIHTIDSLSQPAYLLSGGTMSISTTATTEAYM